MTSTSARVGPIMLVMGTILFHPICASAAEQSDQLGNWFDDPFVQVRSQVPDCPEPLGPRITRQQATQQEHYRVERGTSCYLAGECTKPNAYMYDAPIAAAAKNLFDGDAAFARDSSLWITVSRRFVYLEGCLGNAADIDRAQAMLRSIPDVQLVLVNVTADPHGRLPYQRFKKPQN